MPRRRRRRAGASRARRNVLQHRCGPPGNPRAANSALRSVCAQSQQHPVPLAGSEQVGASGKLAASAAGPPPCSAHAQSVCKLAFTARGAAPSAAGAAAGRRARRTFTAAAARSPAAPAAPLQDGVRDGHSVCHSSSGPCPGLATAAQGSAERSQQPEGRARVQRAGQRLGGPAIHAALHQPGVDGASGGAAGGRRPDRGRVLPQGTGGCTHKHVGGMPVCEPVPA